MSFPNLSPRKDSCRCWRSTSDILKKYPTGWRPSFHTQHHRCRKAPPRSHSRMKIPPLSHRQRSRIGSHPDNFLASLRPTRPHRITLCNPSLHHRLMVLTTVPYNINHLTLRSEHRGRHNIDDRFPSWPVVTIFRATRNVNACIIKPVHCLSIRCREPDRVE